VLLLDKEERLDDWPCVLELDDELADEVDQLLNVLLELLMELELGGGNTVLELTEEEDEYMSGRGFGNM
jgi:hypothetical protein